MINTQCTKSSCNNPMSSLFVYFTFQWIWFWVNLENHSYYVLCLCFMVNLNCFNLYPCLCVSFVHRILKKCLNDRANITQTMSRLLSLEFTREAWSRAESWELRVIRSINKLLTVVVNDGTGTWRRGGGSVMWTCPGNATCLTFYLTFSFYLKYQD